MKQSNIQFDYNADKLEAIRLFLVQKDSTVEASLENYMEQLYVKTVPTNVREYIAMRAGQEQTDTPSITKPTPSQKKRFETTATNDGKTPTNETKEQT